MPVESGERPLPIARLPQHAGEPLSHSNGFAQVEATNLSHLNGNHTEELPHTSEVKYFDAGDYKVPYVEKLVPGTPKIFILPGWCGLIDPEDPALAEFNNLGFSAIQVGTPEPVKKKSKRGFSPTTLQLAHDAEAFTALINATTEEDENVSIIGCSYGGLSAIEVADAIPTKVDHLMLVNPAIRHPIDNVILLTARYTGNMGWNTIKALRGKGIDGFIGAKNVAKEALANPIDSIHRGIGIIHAEGTTSKAYQYAKKGGRITIVTGKGDGIFRGKKTKSRFQDDFTREYQKDIRDTSVVFDRMLNQLMPRFVDQNGGHDLGLAGEAFATFAVEEWQNTQDHFNKLALHAE